jgi:hypothetical protein
MLTVLYCVHDTAADAPPAEDVRAVSPRNVATDDQTAALFEALANPDSAQFHDWSSVLSQFITPDDNLYGMDQMLELFPK